MGISSNGLGIKLRALHDMCASIFRWIRRRLSPCSCILMLPHPLTLRSSTYVAECIDD